MQDLGRMHLEARMGYENVKTKYDDFIADGNLLDARWGTPEDIGKSVAALVRGDLPYATGAIITQDGGLNLPRL